jgi:hypothetical protein
MIAPFQSLRHLYPRVSATSSHHQIVRSMGKVSIRHVALDMIL